MLGSRGTRRSYMTGGYNPFWINGRRYLHYRHRFQLYYDWVPRNVPRNLPDVSILRKQRGILDPSKMMRQLLLPPDTQNFAFIPFEDDEAPDADDYPESLHHLLSKADFQAATGDVWNAIHSQDDDEFPPPWVMLIPPCFCFNYFFCLLCNESHQLEVAQKIQEAVSAACAKWSQKLQRVGLSLAVIDQEGVEGLAIFVAPYNADGTPNPSWTGDVPAMSSADINRCASMIKLSIDPSAPPLDDDSYEKLLEDEANDIVARDGDTEPPQYEDAIWAYSTYAATQKPATAPMMQESAVIQEPFDPFMTSQDLASLPEPWQEIFDEDSGEPYYYNPDTDVSQWQRPISPSAPPPPPPPAGTFLGQTVMAPPPSGGIMI